MARRIRATPEGFRKTSYELQESAKFAVEDLARTLDRDGYPGVSETAIIEALVFAAKREGVDRALLDRVLRDRRKTAEKNRA